MEHFFILLMFILPGICWYIAHIWTMVPPPKDDASKLYKNIYEFCNIFVAANYAYSRNSQMGQQLEDAYQKVKNKQT